MGASVGVDSGTSPGLLSPEDHAALARLVRDHAGIKLGANKRQLLSSRVQKRLRALGLPGYEAYRGYLQANLEQELGELINTITTNLTAFFRENHHFEFLARYLGELPPGRRLAIWSAGCATGEEPYSIGMVCREHAGAGGRPGVRILATDIDTACLTVAERGVYDLKTVKGLDRRRMAAHFLRGKGRNEGLIRARPELRELIEFRPLNLVDAWSVEGPFDVIFCRNVVIYFDDEVQRLLFDRFAGALKPGGLMMIGHSENLQRVSARFRKVGQTIYRRVS